MKTVFFILLIILSGCSSFSLDHEHGSLPKIRIELPPDCGELRLRSSKGKILLRWEKKIDL